MKHLIYLGLFLLAWPAFGENPEVPKPEAAADIPLSEVGELPQVTEVDSSPIGLMYLKLKNGQNYVVPDDPLTPEQKETFGRMSAEDQAAFRTNRAEYLQTLLKILDKGRLPAGFVSAAASKVWALYRRAIQNVIGEPDVDKPSMGERGRRAIQSVLRLADSQLWDKAPVVARANEVGITFEAGAGGGVAVGSYGLYGTTGFGLAVNLNRRDKFVSVEFYQDVERLERAIPFTAGVAVYGALLGNLNHNDWTEPARIEAGEGLSGVGPIMGTFTSESLRVGLGQGVGITPPIVSEIVVVQTKLHRVPWFKIGVSPNVPGYVRVKSAAPQALGAIASGIVQAPGKVFSLIRKGCSGLFGLMQPPPAHADARWYGM